MPFLRLKNEMCWAIKDKWIKRLTCYLFKVWLFWKKVTIFRKNLKIDNHSNCIKIKTRQNKELKNCRKNRVCSSHVKKNLNTRFDQLAVSMEKNSNMIWTLILPIVFSCNELSAWDMSKSPSSSKLSSSLPGYFLLKEKNIYESYLHCN